MSSCCLAMCWVRYQECRFAHASICLTTKQEIREEDISTWTSSNGDSITWASFFVSILEKRQSGWASEHG